jgi:hypothetical protein
MPNEFVDKLIKSVTFEFVFLDVLNRIILNFSNFDSIIIDTSFVKIQSMNHSKLLTMIIV